METKTDFRPLTYSEIMELKPLNIKLSDKYMYTCNLMDCNNLSSFWAQKDYITGLMEEYAIKSKDAKDGLSLASTRGILLGCYKAIITLLYEVGEKPKGYFKKRRYRKWFNVYFIDHYDKLMDLWEKVLVYNSQLFFLLQHLRTLSMVQVQTFSETFIERSLLKKIQGKSTLESRAFEKLRKNPQYGKWINGGNLSGK